MNTSINYFSSSQEMLSSGEYEINLFQFEDPDDRPKAVSYFCNSLLV